MNKKLNKNTGITLISLVITIIIMLILVGVSITLAVKGGLFEYAGNAVGDTKNAIKNEQGTINEIIDYYVKPNAGEKVHNWTRTGDTFACSHCNQTYTMGQEVEYIAKGATSTTLTAQMSGLDKYKEKKSNYPEGNNIGIDGTQTIEAQTNVKWVVLGIDKQTESLLITTSEPVYTSEENGLWLFGAASYNNGPSEINRICRELYSNSEYGYARGMTIEDVNDTLNFTPLGGIYYYDEISKYYTTYNFTTKLENLPESLWNIIISAGIKTPEGKESQEYLGEYLLDGYWYKLENNLYLNNLLDETLKEITNIEKSVIFGEKTDFEYYLASRGVSAHEWRSGAGNVSWGPGMVRDAYVNSTYGLYGSDDYQNGKEHRLRPVVNCVGKLPTVKE